MVKRLLCIVGGMNAGGAETFLMKIYRSLDRSKYQMDFCVSKQEKGFYDDEILSMGGKIIHTTAKTKNPIASFKSIYNIIKSNHYKYVMRISQHSLSALELFAAKMGGAEVRVFRSSNSKTMQSGLNAFLHRVFKFLPKSVANVKIAPSIPAAEFMFGKNCIKRGEVLFLNNGIALDEFSYNQTFRQSVRQELGLKDELLLGHIGRFTTQKNHKFLLQVFKNTLQKRPDAHLILVGEGELEKSIKDEVELMGLVDRVHFMGIRKNINAILSAMDIFVFPSLWEGMPNVVIEAQANGLPCVISDTITSEVKICPNVTLVSLNNTDQWVDKLVNDSNREASENNQKLLRERGYDIKQVSDIFINSVFEKI